MKSLLELTESSWSPERSIAHTPTGIVVWAEFLARIATLARSERLRPGARYAVFARDTVDVGVALFALWSKGCIPVLPATNAAATTTMLSGRVAGFIGDFDAIESMPLPRSGTAGVRVSLSLNSALHLVSFTSGSTSEPKEVVKTVAQLDAELHALESLWGQRLDGATLLATVSHQHLYGLLFKLIWPICAGRTFLSTQIFEPATLRRNTNRQPDCAWISSPAMLKRIPAYVFEALERDHVRAVFSSGGPLPSSAAHAVANALGEPPIEAYGSTECGGVGFRQQWPGAAPPPWQPFPGTTVSTDPEGRLLVRSPHQPDAGWHPVGDKGTVLDDGRFALGKRADRIVKVEERRVSLDAVESALATSTFVREAVAAPVHGSRDAIAAVVALTHEGYRALHTEGRNRFIAALRDELSARLEPIAIPKRWRFVDEIPANEQSKLTQDALDAVLDSPDGAPMPIVQVEHRDTAAARLRIEVSEGLPCFDGHFPGSPVLPGAIQLTWVSRLAAEHLALAERWIGLEAVKFSRIIRPGATVVLELRYDTRSEKLSFEYTCNDAVCSSGRLTLR